MAAPKIKSQRNTSANLSPEERARIYTVIDQNPDKTGRYLAESLGISESTVYRYRNNGPSHVGDDRRFRDPLDTAPTPAELEVLECIADNMTYQQAADELGISINTVKCYMKKMRDRYNRVGRPAHNVLLLLQEADRDGVIRLNPNEEL